MKAAFFKIWTDRIEPFLLWIWSQRIELFSWIWRERNETLISLNMTPRTVFEKKNMKLHFLKYDSKSWTFFLWILIQRVEPFFVEYDSKELKLFFLNMYSKNWTLSPFWIWLKELNSFFSDTTQYDSKNRTLFLWIWRKDLNLFVIWRKELNLFLNMTQRIEVFVRKYDSKDWTLL